MGDVGHEHRANFIGNRTEARKVDDARVGGVTADDHFRLCFAGNARDGLVIEELGCSVEVVLGDLVEGAREVHLQAVRKVPARLDRKRENRVAWFAHRHEDGGVRIRAAVRLNIRKLTAEELLRAIARQVFDTVVELAAAVVALAGIALGILVRKPRTDRVHDLGRDVVFTGDQFERGRLALGLLREQARGGGVVALEHREQIDAHRVEGNVGGEARGHRARGCVA